MSDTTFRTLGVPHPLLEVLSADGKHIPTQIQAASLPDALAGRDVLGRGRTGSGKTLAFCIPMVARLGTRLVGGPRRAAHPLGLVLAPTRELATQIHAVLEPLARAYGLTTTTIYGGVSQNPQVAALRAGVDIVVACPGRLEDLMGQRLVHLDAVELTVLDEADHMADLGFLPGVTRILNATPGDGQRMLFSATLDNGVDKLVRQFLHNPVTHEVDDATSPVDAMTHHVFGAADVEAKKQLVQALASGTGRRILFMRTKHHAKKLAKQLTESGIPAVDLHGNLSQPQRDRNLAAFSAGDARVLVATDVAARGVHIDDVELVVHVDPPTEHKAYLHRSGRTARAGSSGDVVTVVLPTQERDLAQLMRKAGIQAPTQRVTSGSDAVTTLVGEVAPYVKPAPKQARQSGRGGGQGSARGSAQGGAQGAAQGGGRSQGANARRKRAAREAQGQQARHGRPQRDRSGRPEAKHSGGSGRPEAKHSGGSRVVYTSSSSAPTGNPRRAGRRAQG
ncbi:MAG: DEAD/DEAH box helicase [Microbacteriaceae bacterium]|nr:DEAD/DEAH box helicase [Microbacteriaceae bacterium]